MNVKAGDLAYIVNDPNFQSKIPLDAIGVVVEVLYRSLGWEAQCGHPCWAVDCREAKSGITLEGRFTKTTRFVVPDANLRPISGVPIEEEEDIETPVTTE